MRLAIRIAFRYLFSKKSTNAINIISGISGLGIFISSAALIIILSVFNGFEGLVLSAYDTFNPDIKISSKNAKTFAEDSVLITRLTALEGVTSVVQALEEKALISYNDRQCIATVKGFSANFIQHNRGLDSSMIAGECILQEDSENYALLGAGIRYVLSVNVETSYKPLTILFPRKGAFNSINPIEEFNQQAIYPAGAFSVQQEFDEQYVLVPLRFARTLFEKPAQLSAIEISTTSSSPIASVKKRIEELLPTGKYTVLDKYQQNELLYKILNSERWAVYAILTFIMLIAICNIIGSLTMLLIDKKKDIAILQSMGASYGLIRTIYWLEGLLIAGMAGIAGLAAGALFCYLQQRFGFIAAGNAEGSLINAYPVLMQPADFFLVFATILGITAVATYGAIHFALRKLQSIAGTLAVE